MRIVDLFCGAGGWITGLKKNHDVVLAVDIWSTALETLSLNHDDLTILQKNILKLKESDLPKHDIIIGSPPCQPFSAINYQSRTENLSLTKKFLKIVKNSLWIMENVSTLMKYKSTLLNYYKKITNGQDFNCEIIQMSDFGVPQIRRRFIASNFLEFPLKKGKKKEVSNFLPLKIKDIGRIPRHSQKIIEKMRKVKPGKELGYGVYYRVPLNGFSQAVVNVTKSMMIHPIEHRRLTIKEAAVLQTFPHDYKWAGNESEQGMQVANAVPPNFAEHIGSLIKSYV